MVLYVNITFKTLNYDKNIGLQDILDILDLKLVLLHGFLDPVA